ncbi:HNH endonuclease [Cohnella sp. GbtcB17]|uniref:HNH endonuclease n=1 Tax=Cohnella sp. GbtcB17 TaxID=2824762 RepID=UPI001C301D1F|nr:HNH endonuclease [Cohnella sp. GbtcB17]
MPSKPKRPCSAPGCPNLTEGRYCEGHADKARQTDRERGTSAQRGYGAAWRKAREGWLRKHPLCVACERQGKLTPANEVDHIRPHRGDKVLFWDRLNWQSLCKSCHSAKTARENGGFGNG